MDYKLELHEFGFRAFMGESFEFGYDIRPQIIRSSPGIIFGQKPGVVLIDNVLTVFPEIIPGDELFEVKGFGMESLLSELFVHCLHEINSNSYLVLDPTSDDSCVFFGIYDSYVDDKFQVKSIRQNSETIGSSLQRCMEHSDQRVYGSEDLKEFSKKCSHILDSGNYHFNSRLQSYVSGYLNSAKKYYSLNDAKDPTSQKTPHQQHPYS